jgi:secondary thiamine-phosphate synthase enzyme
MVRFDIATSRREVFVDVTEQVNEAVRASAITDGVAFVSSPHTTAGITINENADPDVARDLLHGLGRVCPLHGEWRHAEGNSDAHLKTALIGTSVMVPIAGGQLLLGTWQAIYFAEFDGPRNRGFDVMIVAGIG